MTIEWFGATCIKLTTQDATLVIDPYRSEIGLKLPRLSPDLVAVTDDQSDVTVVGGSPFRIEGPGEYEIKKTFVYGIPVQHDGAAAMTLYLVEAEGVSFAHLGNLGHQLANGELERLEGVDVLFVPVGGHGVLNAEGASSIISAIEPRMVVPMQYKLPGLKKNFDPVSVFAKELGAKESEKLDKLKFAAKDLPQDLMRVVILQS